MSDCAEPPGLLGAGLDLHVWRDLTHGDLAGAFIGRLADGPAGQVRVRTPCAECLLLRLGGAQLPRIRRRVAGAGWAKPRTCPSPRPA